MLAFLIGVAEFWLTMSSVDFCGPSASPAMRLDEGMHFCAIGAMLAMVPKWSASSLHGFWTLNRACEPFRPVKRTATLTLGELPDQQNCLGRVPGFIFSETIPLARAC